MRKPTLIILALLLLVVAWCSAQEVTSQSGNAPSPAAVLAQSDAERTVSDMGFQVQITSFDGQRQTAGYTIWGFLKVGADHNRLLMYFAQPASERGRKLLVDGNIVYLLFPRTTNPVRLSPLQTLIGQASDGDVVRTFASDYTVDALSDTTVDGRASYLLDLSAKPRAGASTYGKVRVWIDRANLHLEQAEFFAPSGILLKRATYGDYRMVKGKSVPFSVDIYAGTDPEKHTIMQFQKVGSHPVAPTEFTRDYLPYWTPEAP